MFLSCFSCNSHGLPHDLSFQTCFLIWGCQPYSWRGERFGTVTLMFINMHVTWEINWIFIARCIMDRFPGGISVPPPWTQWSRERGHFPQPDVTLEGTVGGELERGHERETWGLSVSFNHYLGDESLVGHNITTWLAFVNDSDRKPWWSLTGEGCSDILFSVCSNT